MPDEFGGIDVQTDDFGGIAIEEQPDQIPSWMKAGGMALDERPIASPLGGGLKAEPMEMVTKPVVELPRLEIDREKDTFLSALSKESLNQLAGIPEFFTSKLGVTALSAGTALPRLVAGLFTTDIAKAIYDEGKQVIPNWDSLSDAEKGRSVASIGAKVLMGGMTGRATVKGHPQFIKDIIEQPTPRQFPWSKEPVSATPIGPYFEPTVKVPEIPRAQGPVFEPAVGPVEIPRFVVPEPPRAQPPVEPFPQTAATVGEQIGKAVGEAAQAAAPLAEQAKQKTEEPSILAPEKTDVTMAEPWTVPLFYGDFYGKQVTDIPISKFGDYGKGTYVTPDIEFARQFAKGTAFDTTQRGSGKIHSVESPKPEKLFRADDTPLTKDEISWWENDGYDIIDQGIVTRRDLADNYGGRNYQSFELREISDAWDDFLDKFGYDSVFDGKQLVLRRGGVKIKPAEKPPPAQPAIEGMGGAVQKEFTPSMPMQSAVKNAAVDRDRIARGEPPMMDALRKSDPDLWAQAMNEIDADWTAPDRIIARHKANPFIPTDVETVVLLHRRVDLKNEYNKANREMIRAEQEGRSPDEARAVRDSMGEKLLELEQVLGKGDTAMGTMAGRAFRARQLVMNEDFTMGELVPRREADLGRKLQPNEMAELQKIADENARLNEQLQKRITEIEGERDVANEKRALAEAEAAASRDLAAQKAEGLSDKVIKIAEEIVSSWDKRADLARARIRERMTRMSTGLDPTVVLDLAEIGLSKIGHAALDFARWSKEIVDEFGDWTKPYLKESWDKANELATREAKEKVGVNAVNRIRKALSTAKTDVEFVKAGIQKRIEAKAPITGHVKRLAKYFVQQGVDNAKELVDKVHEVVASVDPSISRRETMDMISGYGDFTPISKDAVSVVLRDLKGQLQQIGKLEDMAKGEAPKKTGFERKIPSDEERRLIKQVEAAKKEGGYTVTDPETQLRTALQAAKTRLENQISDIIHQLQTREKIVKEKKALKPDKELENLKARRDELKKVYDEVFKAPEMTEAERLAAWKEHAIDRIRTLGERLRNKDFGPRKKKDPVRLDKEAIKLNFELNKVHRALLDLRLKDDLSKRTRTKKFFDDLGTAIRFSRALITGFEFSAVLRQGAFTSFSHPVISAKALYPMFKALMKEENQFATMEDILTRENAPVYQRSKLEITETGSRLSNMEEHYMFRLSENARKVPVFGKLIKATEAFQRAYTTFLNVVRVDTFDALAEIYGKDPKTTRDIANLINVATGRGSSSLGKYAVGLNTVLFAPRYSISRFQLLAGQPVWTATNKRMVVNEYAKALAGAATVYTLGMMAGGTVEVDPRSSDFGKVKIGDTRIDPMAGVLQATVMLSRLASGKKKQLSGKVVPLVGEKKFGQADIQSLLADFTMNKLAPLPSTAIKIRQGHDQIGQPYGLKDVVVDTVTPITYRDIYETMQSQGVPTTAALAVLAIFGMGVQNYEDARKSKKQQKSPNPF